MRFDDRLNTVLAQPAANPHDRAVRWRQLVELLARAQDLSSPSSQLALVQIRSDAGAIDPQLRAAAARAIARPQLPVELVAAFASDTIAVSAPILAAVSLNPVQWAIVLDDASPESIRFIRTLYPDLDVWRITGARAAEEAEIAEIEEIEEIEDQPEPSPARPEAEPEPQAEEPPEPEPSAEDEEPSPPPQAAPPPPPPPPPPPTPSPAPIPSISEVLARIENLRQERRVERPAAGIALRPRRQAETPAPLFRWECGPSGEIGWVEGVPRGALIGRSLAAPGEHNGVDSRIQRAFAVRAPFRDAVLTVGGEGPAAGEWKLSGVPAFEPTDGRFAGYRGVAIRSSETAEGEESAQPREQLDQDSLRELVHELKTPLNAIVGFAEIIDGQYLGPAENSYRERAAEIVAQGRLLLSAIEDLDVAAQLRSGTGEGSTDLNALLKALATDLGEEAARHGARFELTLARTPAICTLSQTVLERLLRRFLSAVIDAAEPRERIAVTIDCDVGQCLVTVNRPKAMHALSDSQLFGRGGSPAEALASGFSLKLARGIAQTAGGDLRTAGDKLALVLPRRS